MFEALNDSVPRINLELYSDLGQRFQVPFPSMFLVGLPALVSIGRLPAARRGVKVLKHFKNNCIPILIHSQEIRPSDRSDL